MGIPHVLVIPYPALGHVIPMMELSHCLVKHGMKVTFVDTEYNHMQMKSALALKFGDIGQEIQLLLVPDGLDSLAERNTPGRLIEAILHVMPRKVEELIEQMITTKNISCVVADQSLGWALEIAERKGIPRAAFCPASAAQLALGLGIPKLIDSGVIDNNGCPLREQLIQLSPEMPAINTKNLVWTCTGNLAMQNHIFELMVKNNNSLNLAEWVLCNSSYVLESGALALAPNILPVGPLFINNEPGQHSPATPRPEDSICIKWLDQHPPCSVIYVAFGSFTVFNSIQFDELALGLEQSNRPFLWVVRLDIVGQTNLKHPDGFQERTAGHALMVDWAPQEKVLSHPSVACFLSHCGWNSTVEGISNGIPFLCLPYFADQFLNQNYICDVWRTGLGLNQDDNGVITRDEIQSKIEQLLSNQGFRKKAEALRNMVFDGVKEGGDSSKNFRKFIEWIRK